jgi:hypothetical protein
MILGLRLFMTPLLITAATLAGRKWGPGVSGWLIGFPLTSGPVSIILTLQYGPTFAAQAAIGNLAGLISICAFCVVFSFVAARGRWFFTALSAALAFVVATAFLNSFTLILWPTFVVVLIAITVTLRLVPKRVLAIVAVQALRWDLPARIIVATVFVIILTGIAPLLGPQLSGLITPFPIYAMVLAAFAQRQQGPAAARNLLRGMTWSLFGVAGFFLVVGSMLPYGAIVLTYALATIVVLIVNGIAFRMNR